MIVYVLHHHWDTPDNEGNEILGVYRNPEDAVSQMRESAALVKSYYDEEPAYWDDDMTWEEERVIHLGKGSMDFFVLATIYSWEILRMEVE